MPRPHVRRTPIDKVADFIKPPGKARCLQLQQVHGRQRHGGFFSLRDGPFMGCHCPQPIWMIAMRLRRRQGPLDFIDVCAGFRDDFRPDCGGRSAAWKMTAECAFLRWVAVAHSARLAASALCLTLPKSHKIAFMAALLHLDDEIVVGIGQHMHIPDGHISGMNE